MSELANCSQEIWEHSGESSSTSQLAGGTWREGMLAAVRASVWTFNGTTSIAVVSMLHVAGRPLCQLPDRVVHATALGTREGTVEGSVYQMPLPIMPL